MGERFAVLLISGGHERAHYAFMLAAGAAAMGREVVVFATNEGCRAMMRDWSGIDDAGRDALVRGRGIAGLGALREAVVELGGRLMVCDSGLRMGGCETEPLMAEVAVSGVTAFLSAVGTGQIVTL